MQQTRQVKTSDGEIFALRDEEADGAADRYDLAAWVIMAHKIMQDLKGLTAFYAGLAESIEHWRWSSAFRSTD